MKRALSAAALAALVWLAPGSASATYITASGTVAGNAVSFAADLSLSGTTATVRLFNLSPTNAQEVPGATLTGFGLTIAGGTPSVTPLTAISPNAIISAGSCENPCGGTSVPIGGEWALAAFSGHVTLGSAGWLTSGLPGNIGSFPGGTNLDDPVSLDGINFGILSANAGPLNGGLSERPLILTEADFTFSVPTGTTLADLGSPIFLTGTQPEAIIVGCSDCGTQIPEPATFALLGSGLIGLSLIRRRREIEA